MLFALSENASDSTNRIEMVTSADGELVPVLLDFLERCEQGSSEQYLTLLVLNNISIPSENKRVSVIVGTAMKETVHKHCDGSCLLSEGWIDSPASKAN